LHEPAVLLLDEPTRSLDPLAAADFRRLLKEEIVQRRGTSLLFASHSLEEVEWLANRVLVLEEGKAVALGSPNELQVRANAATFSQAIARLLRHPIESESRS
jgi:ABC-2 type transport system ATP-binding protein